MAAPGTRLRTPARPAPAPRSAPRRPAPRTPPPRPVPRAERRPSAPVESFRRPWSPRGAGAAARATVTSFSQMDGWLLALISGLCAFGLVMVYSASEALGYAWYGNPGYFFQRQFVWLSAGVPLMLVAARVDYHRWVRWSRPLGVVVVVLLLLVLVPHIGSERLGARRWFTLGPLSVQPSAVATMVAIVWFGRWLTERGAAVRMTRTARQYAVLLTVLLLMVVMERDLGSAVVLAAIGVVLAALGGMRKRHLAQLAGGLLVLGWLAIHLESYRSSRLHSFLDPFKDPLNTGFQLVQSLYALGSGGLGGVGLGNSIQKFQWLPEAHTDFIFAIIGEELGLIGCLSVVGAFFLLGWRGVRASMRAPDAFGALLAGGIVAWICIQAFINIAAVTNVLPTTGIPLPFISSGGTSLLMTLVACGVLCNISAQGRAQGESRRAHVDRWRGDGRASHPGAGRRPDAATLRSRR
ncbi:MAG TPA: putative lipid II flippase FtsW [Candidatus Dormibacteraeota bacterium]|nr:putative lipid II flippase FtsW [Candidatus Dormibacteraeota bacterium]